MSKPRGIKIIKKKNEREEIPISKSTRSSIYGFVYDSNKIPFRYLK